MSHPEPIASILDRHPLVRRARAHRAAAMLPARFWAIYLAHLNYLLELGDAPPQASEEAYTHTMQAWKAELGMAS